MWQKCVYGHEMSQIAKKERNSSWIDFTGSGSTDEGMSLGFGLNARHISKKPRKQWNTILTMESKKQSKPCYEHELMKKIQY